MEINFKCIMPKLMKGATPNELIKGVTANLMSIIGQHDYKGKLSMEINFKCIMPKLMKGATPNELIKGVTANLMSIIGQVSEPA
ncbi:hypothetical protein T01_3431 [Trichinella spiralis]|uniref:Uncharacterized protein n=1 Tax=Trichinella spiralis TaxID=6334 RepID=A0A0V1BBQ5_TRISP|nr:hypothetical protein T01_3431 [Trichinella spiralis]